MMTTSSVAGIFGAGAVAAAVAEVADAGPWWIAAIVLPLAGFIAWLVRSDRDRQDAREKVIADREAKREEREEKRAAHDEMQTRALQEAVLELRRLSDLSTDHAHAIEQIPHRVEQLLAQRRPT